MQRNFQDFSIACDCKQAGRSIAKAMRPSGGNVVDLMDALPQSIKGSGKAAAAAPAAKLARDKKGRQPARKAS